MVASEPEPRRTGVECTHCGLPVPVGMVEPGAAEQFCCNGCRTVYAVLHDVGLDAYYDLRESAGEPGQRARTTDRSYAEFDDPAFSELYCRPVGDGLMSVELSLEGVHCSACVWLVERVSLIIDGAVETVLDVGRSVVRVVWDPEATTLSSIARTLDSFGYPSHPRPGAGSAELGRRADRALLGRMAVAGAVAANVMLMAAALYSGMFHGIEPQYVRLFAWGSFIVTLPAVFWSATVFYKGAWGAIRTRTPHMDLPISLGIIAGFLWGAYATFSSSGEIYFDSVTALIFLLLVGRWVQRRQQHAARDAAELLYSLAPSSARVVEGEQVREVPIQAVPLAAIVEVRAGEHFPVDGIVTSGDSTLDASLLTGESRPERITRGSAVHAGCVNLGSQVRIRVEQTGESTRVGRLMKRVEEAARRRAPVVLLADRISGYFVGVVLVLALVTLGMWWFLDPAHAVEHVVALLVVTCPCALGLATPLAVSWALGRAARAGILIKGGDVLERLAEPGLVVFDKTGTLTEGRLAMQAWEGDESLKPLVRAAEAHSAHPVAAAFLRALGDEPEAEVSALSQTLGGGLSAQVSGRSLLIGSQAFIASHGLDVPAWMAESLARHTEAARSPVLIASDGQVAALAAFGDPLRPDAVSSLRALRKLGYRVAVLSGDHPDVVRAVVRELGEPLVEAHGGVSPEAKLAWIERAQQHGPVIMVGDGVNDAAALSAAGVGIAVHGGAEASLAAADVFTTRAGVAPGGDLVLGAHRTLRVIHRNLIFSFLYNLVGVALAMAGLIGPLLAAVLMPLSSITVVTSSFRSRTFDAGRRRPSAVESNNPHPLPSPEYST
jgi:Cu2+-exporting ATPase